jgi:hypothetical protein
MRGARMNGKVSTQYVGEAGAHRVASGLLFRGYNAGITSVDEGLDIVATRGPHLYNIQVKTANVSEYYYYFAFNLSSFEKSNQSNTFYVVILRDWQQHPSCSASLY